MATQSFAAENMDGLKNPHMNLDAQIDDRLTSVSENVQVRAGSIANISKSRLNE